MSTQRILPDQLRAVLRQLPTSPGVYLMKSVDGRVLYVGKADSLRNRVRSYFGARGPEDARISRMVAEVATVEYIVTDTVRHRIGVPHAKSWRLQAAALAKRLSNEQQIVELWLNPETRVLETHLVPVSPGQPRPLAA